ncbi:hypothetical protein PHISCL_03069 [Aspergillus sclerotialis]|uniref:Uncharacterized protein n=1 Tax=Aspergillus sclerotialis TaxID=2070753 RepID=A0A3A3A5F8_9EURO|nr:hypothetical protein PHISCL_03069 [Aspergillus sclerotialis]
METARRQSEAAEATVGEKGEIFTKDPDAQQPSFPGSGENATALGGSRRQFNQGILEANRREREQTKQDEEKLME